MLIIHRSVLEREGIYHNPFMWLTGWFYCVVCKDYVRKLPYSTNASNIDTFEVCCNCGNYTEKEN